MFFSDRPSAVVRSVITSFEMTGVEVSVSVISVLVVFSARAIVAYTVDGKQNQSRRVRFEVKEDEDVSRPNSVKTLEID